MQLAKLKMVDLELDLHSITLEPDAARMLLSCLNPWAIVKLYPATLQQAGVFTDAAHWLNKSHLTRSVIWVAPPGAMICH
jgi:hypothetical protein